MTDAPDTAAAVPEPGATARDLRDRFHEEVRLADRDAAPGFVIERDGPVHRTYPADPGAAGAMVECPEGLGEDPEHWVSRQAAFFRERGQRVEWKTYSYDEPADLPARLERHGFVPEDHEVLLLGRCQDLVHDVALPAGVRLRDIGSDEDWERVRVLCDTVWGTDTSWMNEAFRAEQRSRPDLMTATVVEEVAEDGALGPVVSYAVLRLTEGTSFCGLWGGSTLAAWRGRGLYRALVSHRARTALDRGYPHARVDTSPDSRPILRRLGMHAVSGTRPYVLDASGG
ncbi:GNAT family N-acetyltransferase [Oryzobacter sp. R7]|uniref:GNAT family N-acetyltransferase n=1 Tax=Oryzobacter faecalis TaxID=3388656 RepID=UPI00398CAA54